MGLVLFNYGKHICAFVYSNHQSKLHVDVIFCFSFSIEDAEDNIVFEEDQGVGTVFIGFL